MIYELMWPKVQLHGNREGHDRTAFAQSGYGPSLFTW